MKQVIALLLLFSLSMFFLPSHGQNKRRSKPLDIPGSKGTAIIITGAAARIPQEAALLEELDHRGMLDDVEFIAGASSGALNTVMLNAILTEDYSWERYKRLLFNLRDSDIYIIDDKKLPVDTTPLKDFLTDLLNDTLGYCRVGDLPIPSAISITDFNLFRLERKNFRLSNYKINEESDPDLNLVEVLMASTSFPMAFPSTFINNAPTLPDHSFIDGGLARDHVPFAGLLSFINYRKENVNKIIVVSRKSNEIPQLSEEMQNLGVNDKGIFDKLGISLDAILFKAFINALKDFRDHEPDLVPKTYVYIPDFPENFLLLDFNTLQEQYEITSKWAKQNQPVLLEEYLSRYEKN